MNELPQRFREVRQTSEHLAAPLAPEDCVIQTMPDASPIRWHLAHTTWFFETFILKTDPGYRPFDENFEYLFNSYYNAVGRQYPRPQRGLLSRPSQQRVLEYRDAVNARVLERLESGALDEPQLKLMELGLQHEQQHQELMVTDLKHLLYFNSLYPEYRPAVMAGNDAPDGRWLDFEETLGEAGHDGNGFCFDNELPRHRFFSPAFSLAANLVTCGDYLEFIHDGGYDHPGHWLSLGWQTVQQEGWRAPLYWEQEGDQWRLFTFNGWVAIDPAWPVCHVSYFEADAFARWKGLRLPTELEWERACVADPEFGTPAKEAQFLDRLLEAEQIIHPTRAGQGMLGGVWEWTQSSYSPYPGFRPAAGAVGEYNGKFMCNQYVLRGGSVATPASHIRPSYRNFFPPSTRWQFSGIRLAK